MYMKNLHINCSDTAVFSRGFILFSKELMSAVLLLLLFFIIIIITIILYYLILYY